MAGKQFELPGVGEITIVKRASSRNIRLSIRGDGKVLVSIPSWSSYRSGLSFAQSKLDWLASHVPKPSQLTNGQPIGKSHHLLLLPTAGIAAPRTLVSKTSITVRYPAQWQAGDPAVQAAASAACLRALRTQASLLLPQRLATLAEQHDFTYTSVTIKRLKGRWGSCDSQQRIVLNLFLMQLPWDCIDYVLLHELTHTKILRHGPPFWGHMATLLPNLTTIRKQMRGYQPVLQSGSSAVQ